MATLDTDESEGLGRLIFADRVDFQNVPGRLVWPAGLRLFLSADPFLSLCPLGAKDCHGLSWLLQDSCRQRGLW